MTLAIGIDLGGTNLKGAAVDRDGRVVARHDQPIDRTEPDILIGEMAELVSRLAGDAQTEVAALVGVGVGSPGPLSIRQGRIIKAANLPGWIDVPLRATLGERLKVPVLLENDGNAAAYGEFWVGAGVGSNDLVMLTLGTGVGAGVVLDGKILHGHFENAAELGHTIVELDGLPCSCGQRGCLEQYASASGVARRAMSATHGDTNAMTCEEVVQRAREGDPVCMQVWDDACRHLAAACINIQHTYNPECVVLGGGMSNAGAFLLDRVTEHVIANRWSLHDDVPSIRLATLGYNAGVIGAAGLVWKRSGSSCRAGRVTG